MNANQHVDLASELDLWRSEGQKVKVWWRDDDAVSPSNALEKLSVLSEQYGIPVLLAVIPKHADQSLAHFVKQRPHFSVGVHGYAHTNHAQPGQKKTELTFAPPNRSLENVLEELAEASEIIAGQFGRAASEILVPPWNRIDMEVAERLTDLNFNLLSGFTQRTLGVKISQLNCHLDLMHWKPERKGKHPDEALAELATCLREARLEGFKPIGILSHHLVHDEAAWDACKRLMAMIHEHPLIEPISIENYMTEKGL